MSPELREVETLVDSDRCFGYSGDFTDEGLWPLLFETLTLTYGLPPIAFKPPFLLILAHQPNSSSLNPDFSHQNSSLICPRLQSNS